MSRIIARLLPLLLLVVFQLHSGNAGAQQRDRSPSLNLGDAVVTGFSGTLPPDATKPHPANTSAIDLTFINPDGPSARVIDIRQPGFVWDGRLLAAPKIFDVLAKDVGQVFGIALDDQAPPNIYVAATSMFGLNIVDRGRDGLPERRKKGGPGAGWMKGQFGLDLQGGPGAIYRVDGRTGVVTLLANVTLDGVPNPGTGLGNLAYDFAHKQLFVSDLYTGMIHRFDLDGNELSRYDHGVTGLGAAKLATVPFDPKNRPNIASERFDSEKPDTWGFAPAARRVWGLAVHEDRLYYSVVAGPQIWSVGIASDGSFAADPRWELDVPAQAGPLPVSDIAFSYQGAMILAQRGLIAGAYDYSAFTQPGEPQVLRFWLKDPNDPPSPGRWKLVPEEYAIGFAGNYRNTNGGVALGYGYGQDGMLSATVCEAALWTTGQNFRNNPALRSQLEPGGPLVVHGLQASPADLVRNANTPPVISYFVDYDDKFDDPRATGHIGSVRVYTTPCAATAYVPPIAVAAGCGWRRRWRLCRPGLPQCLHADLRVPAGHRARRQGMREAGLSRWADFQSSHRLVHVSAWHHPGRQGMRTDPEAADLVPAAAGSRSANGYLRAAAARMPATAGPRPRRHLHLPAGHRDAGSQMRAANLPATAGSRAMPVPGRHRAGSAGYACRCRNVRRRRS